MVEEVEREGKKGKVWREEENEEERRTLLYY